MLPLLTKFFVAFGISIIFVVFTQWERLGFDVQWERLTRKQPPAVAVSKAPVPPQQIEQRSFNFPVAPAADKIHTAEVQALLTRRMGRLVIDDPSVRSDGSILGNGQTLYLYGIRKIDSKKVCSRASGEPWACGLHAYAMLRNTITKKTIVCDPKTLLPNAVTATCRIGSTDIALMLVSDGLAGLANNIDDTDLMNAQASAKSRKLGIWDR